MNSIEAMEYDIATQPRQLPEIARGISPLSSEELGNILIAGAGDSYAAALLAHYASGGVIGAVDPMEIILQSARVRGRGLVVISVSGKTTTNIKAAEIARKEGARVTAVTANPESPLAKAADDVILLTFEHAGVLTSGTIGFTASAVVCLSLVKNLNLEAIDSLYSKAMQSADSLLADSRFMIGCGITFPIALYAAAKCYEVFGGSAQYCMLEQFGHMELFSCREGDRAVIFQSPGDASEKAASVFDECGLKTSLIRARGETLEELVLYYTFLVQQSVVKRAKEAALEEVYFKTNRSLKRASDTLIY